MKIDIISDVVCPWCIVGYKHFEAALAELGWQENVEIEWQPFELNPNLPPEGEDLREHVARKYGASLADSDNARRNITAAGAEYGFEFNYFDGMKIVNTLDAHVLLDYANELGKQTDLKLRLFSAFFTEKKDVSQQAVLVAEAAAVGIEQEQALTALNSLERKRHVQSLAAQWQQMGVTSVPTFVFNRSSALSGAQPQHVFKQVLEELQADQ